MECSENKWCFLKILCFDSFGHMRESAEKGRGYLTCCAGGCSCILVFIAVPGLEVKAG